MVNLAVKIHLNLVNFTDRARGAGGGARGDSSGGTRVTPKDEIASERVTLIR